MKRITSARQEKTAEKLKQEKIDKGLGRNTLKENNPTEPSKFRKIDTERAGPEEPPTRLPLRDSIGYPESNNPRSSPESGTRLMWKYSSSSEGAQRRVRDTSSQDAVRGLDCSFYRGGEGEASAGLDRSNSLWTRQFVGNN